MIIVFFFFLNIYSIETKRLLLEKRRANINKVPLKSPQPLFMYACLYFSNIDVIDWNLKSDSDLIHMKKKEYN